MKTTLQVTACVAAAVAVGTAYVLVHESRRKAKKAARLAAGEASSSSEGLNAERLIFVLGESARGAYQLIEQTRRIVHEKHVQTGQPLETCVDELQKDFEAASACQPRALLPFLRYWGTCRHVGLHGSARQHGDRESWRNQHLPLQLSPARVCRTPCLPAVEAVIASIRSKHGVSEKMMTEAMMAHQQDPAVQAAVTALREAMNGKAPPGYAAATEAAAADAAKQRLRRGKSKGGGKR